MISNNIILIFWAELALFAIGSILLGVEITTMKKSFNNKLTLYLLGFLVSLNLMFLSRLLGIYFDNIFIRQVGAALFGIITGVFLISWAGSLINLDSRVLTSFQIISVIGVMFFIFGTVNDLNIFFVSGALMIAVILIFLIVKMFVYVFSQSPYLRGRHKIFLMTISFVPLIIFESIGVMYWGFENYSMSSLFLLMEVPCRIGITLSIVLPQSLARFLSKFIY